MKKKVDLYKKYSHIIPGSIEEVPKGQIVVCGNKNKIVSHGKICIIRCINENFEPKCLKTRIINVQDAAQVDRCTKCVRRARNKRRRAKQKLRD